MEVSSSFFENGVFAALSSSELVVDSSADVCRLSTPLCGCLRVLPFRAAPWSVWEERLSSAASRGQPFSSWWFSSSAVKRAGGIARSNFCSYPSSWLLFLGSCMPRERWSLKDASLSRLGMGPLPPPLPRPAGPGLAFSLRAPGCRFREESPAPGAGLGRG